MSRRSRIASLVLTVSVLGALAAPGAAMAGENDCSTIVGYKYKVTSTSAQMLRTFYANSFRNDLSYPITGTSGTSAGGTASVTVSASGTFDLNAIVVGVKATVGTSATASVSIGFTSGVSFSIPAKSTVWAYYGVSRYVTTGRYYWLDRFCVESQVKTITTKVPNSTSKGWVVSPVSLAHD